MKGLTYKDAGVDIARADEYIGGIKERIAQTFNRYVLNSVGGFASLIEVPEGYKRPVLASSTDGVGTKLKIAFMADKHDTVGIDLVAMSANDLLTMGAKPLYFLDYYACGRLEKQVYRDVISGICDGCEQAQCALVGGETAEMPSFYAEGEYDLAGFITGVVEKDRIIDGSRVKEGDVIIGLSSSGFHSNGYSLVRKVFFDLHGFSVFDRVQGLEGALFEELLRPTKIYVRSVHQVIDRFNVAGMAHITGGGLPGNIERVIPDGLAAVIDVSSGSIPPVFKVIMNLGDIPFVEMCSTFNMGVGYVVIVDGKDEKAVIDTLKEAGETAVKIGEIVPASDARKVHINSDLS